MKFIFTALIFLASQLIIAQSKSGYKVSKTFHIPSAGGWDYILADGGKLYVSHGTQVNILDQKTGDSLGYIPNTLGVHGIAINPDNGKGYTSNGRLNTITVFNVKTMDTIRQIPVGQNPDAIMYEPFTKKIITCNGRSNNLSIVDPVKEAEIATVALEGKPETAVSDGMGKLYVNIEDKSKIAVVDLKTNQVIGSWPLSPGEGPTGLAFDVRGRRLFAGCDKQLIVMNADNGSIVEKVPIGNGCDGVAFDNSLRLVFASCGEGVLSIVHEISADNYSLVENLPTKRSARTIGIDERNHEVFLPAADMQPPAAQGERPRMVPGTFQILVVSK
jgi:YVTN family beta-propeller protein